MQLVQQRVLQIDPIIEQYTREAVFAYATSLFCGTVMFGAASERGHGHVHEVEGTVHFTGKADLERDISHAATGWKSALLKPLSPFFRHNDAGAIVSIAVTGTAKHPKIEQNVLHNK